MRAHPTFIALLLAFLGCEPADTTGDASSCPSCPSCPAELPAESCPALPLAQLVTRCAQQDASPHVVAAGCWDGSCPVVPPPDALYLGALPCAQGVQEPEVQLFCW